MQTLRVRRLCFVTLGCLWLLMAGNAQADGWNDYVRYTVKAIIMEGADDGSSLTIRVNPDLTTAQTSCPSRSYLKVDGSTQRGQYIMSAIMTAYASGAEFHLATSGCVGGSRPLVIGVWLLP